MGENITVSPFYYSAVNEITKPNSLVFTSHYFVDRWIRDLGPVGTAIVTVLRSHCYQNRAKGELRNRIQLSVPAIAAEVGVSPKTVRREMNANKVLQKFIQRREEYAPGPTPQSLRTDAYSYLVAMDDPVHPFDEELLQEAIKEKLQRMEKGGGEGDAKTRARQKQSAQKPPGQNDQAAEDRVVNLTPPPGQIVPPGAKLSTPPGQIDQALKDSSDSLKFKENPSSDFPLSLFEKSPDFEQPAQADWAALSLLDQAKLAEVAWAKLPEADRAPWLLQAERELIALYAGTGLAVKPRLIEARGANLYEMSLRGKEPKS